MESKSFVLVLERKETAKGVNGLWHQVLTDAESYEETSCTAIFIYGFAKGIRHGWLPSPEPYTAAVQLAWQGLTNHSVDELGNVHGVCRGSNFSYSEAYSISLTSTMTSRSCSPAPRYTPLTGTISL
ncbi:glycoside hydrolase family 88 protein [Paenibacillus anseongense]|uniref:glycoside hydrolase family 88 protein n=1 Tax=Paenibacillus TaxID=44249 RepID=UPI002DBA19CF|nr:glycoside hydrolase family 88 protein [Paenibacillus anseongense]MEC0267393.1 glycoside hydrolase family 88 protein [Paenibacillus anseongense]